MKKENSDVVHENIKKKAIDNTKIAILTQIIVLILGLIKSFLIPLIVSVESFGYWQIYLLYLPYIGLFFWGFNDGIYLRYGKYDYDKIPAKRFRGALKLFLSMLTVETVILFFLSFFIKDYLKQIAIALVIVNIPIKGIYGSFIYILQITNNIKKYCIYSIVDKVIFLLVILVSLIFKIDSFIFLVIADIISSFLVTVMLIIENRVLLFGKSNELTKSFKEFKINIKAGINIMFASFMALLFSGVGKIFVERLGNIEEYAYFSFGMLIINLLLTLFSSISMVIYPMLKRLGKETYGEQYITLGKYFEMIASFALFSYFIACIGVEIFFKSYIPVLNYLNLLFGLAVFQGKINLLNITYYKLLREDKRMLFDYIISIIFFILLCLLMDTSYKISLVTLFIMGHRCIDSEVYLAKKMNITCKKDITNTLIMIGIFIISTGINLLVGFLAYLFYFIVYVWNNRKEFERIIKSILNGKKWGKKNEIIVNS